MGNLREQINKDLQETMETENDWGLPIILIAPDGTEYNTKKDSTDRLSGQVLYHFTEFSPDTGEDIVVNMPVVTLRISSLERVPLDGENWVVKIPEENSTTADFETYIFSTTKALKLNRSIGIIKLYLQKVKQS